ncbi:MAG: 4-hydroxy-tetrahydrodipicolinate reductase [Gammaproteobacteria bacterium]
MSAGPIRIAIAGAAGRMGRSLIDLSRESSDLAITAALEREGSPHLGRDAGIVAGGEAVGVPVTGKIDEPAERGIHKGFDVLIDFTMPQATLEHLAFCRAAGRRMVIGTTGLTEEDRAVVVEASADCAIVMAPNMSVGVNVCLKLLQIAARALGEDYDVEIVDAHHRHKVDAPSGTALRMGEVVAAASGRDLGDCAVYTRHGMVGGRPARAIGFATLRAGDIVGEHKVLFAGQGERIEIAHLATSRTVFARGALLAARWVMDRGPGLYDMQDVLGLKAI